MNTVDWTTGAFAAHQARALDLHVRFGSDAAKTYVEDIDKSIRTLEKFGAAGTLQGKITPNISHHKLVSGKLGYNIEYDFDQSQSYVLIRGTWK